MTDIEITRMLYDSANEDDYYSDMCFNDKDSEPYANLCCICKHIDSCEKPFNYGGDS